MSSPETFERRIDEAARALRGRAPDVLAQVRAGARDLDASLDAAARALAPTAPADAWTAIQTDLADPDAALDAAARAATPAAPRLPFSELLAKARWPDARRRRTLRRRLVLLSGVPLAAAAAVVALALLLARERGAPKAVPAGLPTLLSARQLEQAESDESRLLKEGDELARRVTTSAAAASESGQALLEEAPFLDDAIAECRAALASNERHPQLRRQLEELARRRVELFRRVEALPPPAPGPADGGGRG